MKFVTALCLRASAHLSLGQGEEALRDIELSFRLCRDMNEGLLITHLVQCTCVRQALTSVWEGLAERRSSAAQLARLQADLQRLDLLTACLSAIRSERAIFNIRVIDECKMRHDIAPLLPTLGTDISSHRGANSLMRFGGCLMPSGWFDLNKTTITRFEQDYFVEAIDPETRRFLPDRFLAGGRALDAMRSLPTTLSAKTVLPIGASISKKSALMQTGLDEALTTCALERFFFERQRYPAGLDELVPAYLERVPTDVINGAPLRYRPAPDGRYQLYGIGWNARDDGGKVVWQTPRKLDDMEGDWVWQYAELQPPPAGTQ